MTKRLEKEGCYPDDLPAFGDLYQHIFENGVESEIRRYMEAKAIRDAPESPNQWMEKRLAELDAKTEP